MIIITGSTGALGKIVIKELSQKFKLRSLSRRKPNETIQNVEYLVGDLNSKNFLSKAFQDVKLVLHFAAETRSSNRDKLHNANILLTSNILEIMKNKGIKALYFTSTILEDICISNYSKSKLECSKIISIQNQYFFKSYKIPPIFDDVSLNKKFTLNRLQNILYKFPIFLSPIRSDQKIPILYLSKLLKHINSFIESFEKFNKNPEILIPKLEKEYITLNQLINKNGIIIYIPYCSVFCKIFIKILLRFKINLSPSLETLYYIS